MKKVTWILFLLVLALVSYYREVVFISINAVIAGSDNFYAKTSRIDLFVGKSPKTLVNYKYIMTIGFTALFAVVTTTGLRLSFKNKLPFYLAIVLYCLSALFAIAVLVYSAVTNSFDSVYSLLRLMIEYLHNPLVYIILSASFLGYSYSQNH